MNQKNNKTFNFFAILFFAASLITIFLLILSINNDDVLSNLTIVHCFIPLILWGILVIIFAPFSLFYKGIADK